MIKIELYLNDSHEVEVFNRALALIESSRFRSVDVAPNALEITPNGPAITPLEPVAVGAHDVTMPPPSYTGGPHLNATVPAITPDMDAEAAMTVYLKQKGVAAAREVLDAFKVRRVRELPAEQRAAFVAALVSK